MSDLKVTKEDQEVIDKIIKNNGGADPLLQAGERLAFTSKEELQTMVFIAGNAIGGQLNGGNEFTSPGEALNYLILGIREIFDAYDTATLATAEPISSETN